MTRLPSQDPVNRLVEAGLLLDIYGGLLTERQRAFMRLHFEEDLSFSEIAREYKISRQAVHDSVKHAVASLHRFEKALGLVQRFHGSEEEPPAPDVRRDVIHRLDALRSRVGESAAIQDPRWIAQELAEVMHLLSEGEEEAVTVRARASDERSDERPDGGES